jgi:two-component system, OmpR family, KDP operon response regulator KdpE
MNAGTILIVDDEPQIRRVLRTTLSAQGYEVMDARSGEEALERVREEHVDMILLDLNMPGMGGLAACREIRSKSDVAIMMLTVRSDESDKVAALDAGADDYITKPFSIPELLARIRAAMRRLPVPPSSGTQIVSLDGIEINMATRRVRTQGKEVRLTPKEYDLLGYLLANPDVPIPHGKLLQAVWGPDYGSEVEYLRVFMNQLRKKIEPDPAHPRFLLTEPWVGYRFNTSGVV